MIGQLSCCSGILNSPVLRIVLWHESFSFQGKQDKKTKRCAPHVFRGESLTQLNTEIMQGAINALITINSKPFYRGEKCT